jgi:hypothetical protein
LKTALVTAADTEVNFLPELKKYLASKIANIEVEEFVLPSVLDIPAKISSAEGYDLVFVSYIYSRESAELKAILAKLLDIELSTGKQIMKAVFMADPDEDYSADELAERHGKRIVKALIGVEPE